MRVILADGQAKVRSALRLLLEQEPEMTVVGEASAADELLSLASAARPDVVLLSWELPGMVVGGQPKAHPVLPALQALDCKPLVVALSGRPEAGPAALGAGADCFVSKGDPPDSLLTAMRNLCAGGAR
ncbi:MAG: response regulator [Chloroflexi bacterium]|nr:response regulator [Chloroflexota bacterium]MCL5107339.1 response regulator [Chloroflexota bacterium]